jgi:hypothetical protein
MVRRSKTYTILSGDDTRYWAPAAGRFESLLPRLTDDAIALPDGAWLGYYGDTRAELQRARAADPDAHMEPIDDEGT